MQTALTKAFNALRRQGFLAYQNCECCQSCAGYKLATMAVELQKAGKPPKGCVYFHAQDNADRLENRSFCLAFGGFETTEFGRIGLEDAEVGRIVCEELTKAGVRFEWDGNPSYRIQVAAGQ